MRYAKAFGLMLFAVLVGCASKEELPVRSAVVPVGVNISGQWQLHDDSSNTRQRLQDAEVSAAGGHDRISGRSQRSSRDQSSLVHVFLESGKNLKITQTEFAIFISFDRAIVEEYRFGEYRQISVGPVNAQRSSGWEQGAYIIETLDDDGNKLRERYLLEDNGQLLIRHITIWKKKVVDLSLVQKFDRA